MSNNNAAEKRWECFATLCKEMNELADEIIEWSEDGHYRDRLIHLYDLADTVFGAKNVKRLLAALEEKNQRIAELEQPIKLPAGFRIVPIKPTREQLSAVQVAGKSVVYTDMVLAAPEHPGFKAEGE